MIDDSKLLVERVQTGVRMEKRLLKVLKAFAEYHDMSLGDLLEGIVLHAFDGKTPFSPASSEKEFSPRLVTPFTVEAVSGLVAVTLLMVPGNVWLNAKVMGAVKVSAAPNWA